MNLPNKLSLMRVLLVPIFMVFTIIDNVWTRLFALIIFIAAALTDIYDGYVARKWGLITTFGKFIDPLADKFLISAALICFVDLKEIHVPAWMVVLIIGREFLITGLRLVGASKGVIIPADKSGKFKTTSQIISIIMILIILCVNSLLNHFYGVEAPDLLNLSGGYYFGGWILNWLPYWLIFITTLLTLISGINYLYKNRYLFSEDLKSKNI